MKRAMPEFAAVPIVIVLLGLSFVIMLAAEAGAAEWLALGVALLAVIVVTTLVLMRRPRGPLAVEPPVVTPRAEAGRRVLLVVDAECSQQDLAEFAALESGTEFFVVAPAVSSRVARWTGDEHAYAHAQEHLDATVLALSDLGFAATGHVGAHDPLQAADEALREFPADEVVFVPHGAHETDWLEQGVVDEARARYDVPVRELGRGVPTSDPR